MSLNLETSIHNPEKEVFTLSKVVILVHPGFAEPSIHYTYDQSVMFQLNITEMIAHENPDRVLIHPAYRANDVTTEFLKGHFEDNQYIDHHLFNLQRRLKSQFPGKVKVTHDLVHEGDLYNLERYNNHLQQFNIRIGEETDVIFAGEYSNACVSRAVDKIFRIGEDTPPQKVIIDLNCTRPTSDYSTEESIEELLSWHTNSNPLWCHDTLASYDIASNRVIVTRV